MQSSQDNNWTCIIKPRTRWFDIDFAECWQYRDLIGLFVKRDFTVKYKQTVLGPFWAVLQPIFMTLVFSFVFGKVAKLGTDGVPEFLFYMCGNLVWHYFQNCLTNNSNTFIENIKIFTKIYFPRLLVPLSTIITNFITFAIQLVLFWVILAWYRIFGGFEASINWGLVLLSIPATAQLALIAMGCGMILTSMTTKYRDCAFLVGFGMQLWMYATPVAYSSSLLTRNYYWVYMLNPVTPIVELYRSAYFGLNTFSIQSYFISMAFMFVVLALGIIRFSKIERTFVDTI